MLCPDGVHRHSSNSNNTISFSATSVPRLLLFIYPHTEQWVLKLAGCSSSTGLVVVVVDRQSLLFCQTRHATIHSSSDEISVVAMKLFFFSPFTSIQFILFSRIYYILYIFLLLILCVVFLCFFFLLFIDFSEFCSLFFSVQNFLSYDFNTTLRFACLPSYSPLPTPRTKDSFYAKDMNVKKSAQIKNSFCNTRTEFVHGQRKGPA